MVKFQLSYPGAPLDYPTLGFIAEANGAILDGTLFTPDLEIPPDARWSVYGGGSAETNIDRYAAPSEEYIGGVIPEVTAGYLLAYDADANTYVPTSPDDVLQTDAWATSLSASYVGKDAALPFNAKAFVERVEFDNGMLFQRSVDHTQNFVGEHDPMASEGMNFSVDRGRITSTMGAIGTSFEGRYRWDGEWFQEFYLTHLPRAGAAYPGANAFIRPLAFTAAEEGSDSAKPYMQGHLAATRFQFLLDDMATQIAVMDGDGFRFDGHHVFMDSTVVDNAQLRFGVDGDVATYLAIFRGDPAFYLWDADNNRAQAKFTFGANSAAAVAQFNSLITTDGGLTVTGAAAAHDSTVAGNANVFFRVDGVDKWYLGNFRGDASHYLWNPVNSRYHVKYSPGASDAAAVTHLQSTLKVGAGFAAFGVTPPAAQPAHPTTLADVITILTNAGLCA